MHFKMCSLLYIKAIKKGGKEFMAKRRTTGRKTTRRTSRKETVAQKTARYIRSLATGKQSNGRSKLTSNQRSYNQGYADCYHDIKISHKHRS